MTYTRNTIWNKRLPRGLGFAVLLFALATIFWLSRNAVLLGSKAAADNTPKDLQISNITNNTFTVSYLTDQSITGSIAYGNDPKFGKVAFDTRDTTTPMPHIIHYATVKGLSPSTKYFFSIVSGDASFLKNGIPYEITTAAVTATASAQQPISGKATLDGGNIPTEAVAYTESDNSQLLSSLLLPGGSYKLPLDTILKKDLTGGLIITPSTVLHINIVNSTLKSRISTLASQTNPIPPVILSKDYDFSISNEPLSSPSSSESAKISGFPTSGDTSQPVPQILTPQTSQEFKDQQPQFSGKALPGNDVEITIQSNQEITTTVQADNSGNWKYRPDTKLAPGQHTLTIKTLDASGIIKTLSQSFTVFAEGSQFVEPSISPSLLPSPTASPTAVPTIAPTSSPSAIPTPIVIITTPIVSTPSATTIPHITTPPIPKSGSSVLTFGIIGTILSIGVGGLLFLLL